MIGIMSTRTGNKHQLRRLMVFVDGENMVFNYQSTLKDDDRTAAIGVIHNENTYVWHPHSFDFSGYEVIRFIYYTFCVGDDIKVEEIKSQIKKLSYVKDQNSVLPTYLRPSVFKKSKQGKKTKGVDIQMTVDILSNVFYDNVDTVLIVTGDGDFLPIINEIIRTGKQVILASFEKGLNKSLLNHIDDYIQLDKTYFK